MHGKGELRSWMRNELEMMNQLNHKKLIRLYDAYEGPHTFTLVTEMYPFRPTVWFPFACTNIACYLGYIFSDSSYFLFVINSWTSVQCFRWWTVAQLDKADVHNWVRDCRLHPSDPLGFGAHAWPEHCSPWPHCRYFLCCLVFSMKINLKVLVWNTCGSFIVKILPHLICGAQGISEKKWNQLTIS